MQGYREFDFNETPEEKPKRLSILPLAEVTVDRFDGGDLIARPQIPFRASALFIPYEQARLIVVRGVFVGVNLQLVDAGDVPGELFAWTCGHNDCEGKHHGERADNAVEALGMMAACIEAHPDQPRAVRHWAFDDALPGIEIRFLLRLAARTQGEAVNVHGCLLGERIDYEPPPMVRGPRWREGGPRGPRGAW